MHQRCIEVYFLIFRAMALPATVFDGSVPQLLVLGFHALVVTHGAPWEFSRAMSFYFSVDFAVECEHSFSFTL